MVAAWRLKVRGEKAPPSCWLFHWKPKKKISKLHRLKAFFLIQSLPYLNRSCFLSGLKIHYPLYCILILPRYNVSVKLEFAALFQNRMNSGKDVVVGNKIRILIADDNAYIRKGLSELLKVHADMEIVGEAVDGMEAWNLAHILNPDVILMDIRMPNMDGLEATRKIVSELPKTRIVGLSINDDADTVAAMKAAGAGTYLVKGCDNNFILAAVRKRENGTK